MTGKIIRTADRVIYYNSDGKFHREDGPAVDFTGGEKYWFINGKHITHEVNQWKKEMGFTNDELTPEESVLFMLYFGNR